jgi:DNA modification methylase
MGLGNPVEVAASNAFNGYRLCRHVWAGYVRESGETRLPHPTQKPVGLMQDSLRFVGGDIFLDPFSGSGTTIIACEQLGRKCRAVEISPSYVAVAIQRWVDVTGGEPALLDTKDA